MLPVARCESEGRGKTDIFRSMMMPAGAMNVTMRDFFSAVAGRRSRISISNSRFCLASGGWHRYRRYGALP